jgi:hypothetical protein
VTALGAARAGLRAVARNWGLALLLLLLNVLAAATLALPLSSQMEAELQNKDAAANMTYGFDFNWWSEWHDRHRESWPGTFAPDVFGIGFAYRNLDLMLKGALPAALLGRPGEGKDPALDPLLLELGALYVLAQVFFTGGVLGVLRAPAGGWTVRALLHGSGFYFGRLLRLALVSLAVLWILFQLYAPLSSWADFRARESVSERTAMVWSIGRHLLLLLAILFVNMVNGYAKAAIALEERSSALLAWISSLAFCLRHPGRVAGHYALLAAAAVFLLALWSLLDGAWNTTGYVTQIPTLLLLQGFVFGRIFLRLALLGGQLEIYRAAA